MYSRRFEILADGILHIKLKSGYILYKARNLSGDRENRMKYVKCPRCDLNYMLEGEPYCDVCKAELKIGPQIKFAAFDSDEEQDQVLCPICKRNFIDDGEEMCEECREARKRSDKQSGRRRRSDAFAFAT